MHAEMPSRGPDTRLNRSVLRNSYPEISLPQQANLHAIADKHSYVPSSSFFSFNEADDIQVT